MNDLWDSTKTWETVIVEVNPHEIIGLTSKEWWEEPETTIIQDKYRNFDFQKGDKVRIIIAIEDKNYEDTKDSWVGVVHEIMESCLILKTYTGRLTLYRYERTLTRGLIINNYILEKNPYEIGDVLRLRIQRIEKK